MPDSHSSAPLPAAAPDKIYTIPGDPATLTLTCLLRERIAAEGSLDFAAFMATALYHPELGYYARPTRQVGRHGDFFTSVSVGPLFGELLARRFRRWWQAAGCPENWRLIECGAHDGTLAADILAALGRLDPAALAALEYAIPEPLPRLQAAQRETLHPFAACVRFLTSPAELASHPVPGIAFGNELLDALPFEVVEWQADGWHSCKVGCGPVGGFCWETHDPLADPALAAALAPLGGGFPIGYRSEVRAGYGAFFEPLLAGLSSGMLLWLDYGFARPDYYHPARHHGTLRTFSGHRAAANPLLDPGAIDITAHVDFTAVAEAASALGCRPLRFCNQGSWLTEVGRGWLLGMEGQPDASLLRQFQTLTHPAHLGGYFHVLEMAWNDPAPATFPAADRHRLALPWHSAWQH
ncbi:MAG: SAM-dependent methyltransferase [Verrucomicrobiota bacterium]